MERAEAVDGEGAVLVNLDQAIEAHTQWKIRLLAAVNGGTIPNRATVCVDNACDLGKWIYGEGARECAQSPEFVALREAHKRFHASVGSVIDLVGAGKKDDAKAMILCGEFAKCSSEVVRAISALKRKAA